MNSQLFGEVVSRDSFRICFQPEIDLIHPLLDSPKNQRFMEIITREEGSQERQFFPLSWFPVHYNRAGPRIQANPASGSPLPGPQ